MRSSSVVTDEASNSTSSASSIDASSTNASSVQSSNTSGQGGAVAPRYGVPPGGFGGTEAVGSGGSDQGSGAPVYGVAPSVMSRPEEPKEELSHDDELLGVGMDELTLPNNGRFPRRKKPRW